MASRCEVSDREFFDLFESTQACVLAAFDAGIARVSRIITDAARSEAGWDERLRAGLSALLGFFDAEPQWARLLVIGPSVARGVDAERRRLALGAAAVALTREMRDKSVSSRSCAPGSRLRAELIVGGIFAVVRGRILEGATERLVELVPSLMRLITLPYESPDAGLESSPRTVGSDRSGCRDQRRPLRATYRTTRVLTAIGATPRLSNREIARAAGMSDEGQTSKLLRRLEQRGLVENVGLGQAYGGANAWLLTGYGERVLDATRHSLVPGSGGAVARHRVRGAA